MSRVLDLLTTAHGQCRLVFVSATQLRLQTHNGRNLNVNGLPERVPTGGVTIGNGGLAANTTYFVYAFMNAGAMALELSTTGGALSGNGVAIKVGDETRTLVGMARTTAATEFAESGANLLVLSYFNRRRKVGFAKFTANRTMTPATNVFSEVHTEIRVNFLTWGDEPVHQAICGGWTVTGLATATGYCNIDNDTSGQRAWCSHSASTTGTFSSVDHRAVSEGFHFGSLTGNCEGGTNALWLGGRNGEVSQVLTIHG